MYGKYKYIIKYIYIYIYQLIDHSSVHIRAITCFTPKILLYTGWSFQPLWKICVRPIDENRFGVWSYFIQFRTEYRIQVGNPKGQEHRRQTPTRMAQPTYSPALHGKRRRSKQTNASSWSGTSPPDLRQNGAAYLFPGLAWKASRQRSLSATFSIKTNNPFQ